MKTPDDYKALLDGYFNGPNGVSPGWNARFLKFLDDNGLELSTVCHQPHYVMAPWPAQDEEVTFPRNMYIVDKKPSVRDWLNEADDPAVRAWLHIRNGPNALKNSVNYLRVRNTVYSVEGQEVLENLLSSVARAAFELGRA